ncbi:MAG: hypothetical protein RIC56_05910 [Pseudomonadales bacterium]
MPAPEAAATRPLEARIRQELDDRSHRDDPNVARLVAEIRRRHGDAVKAVLLYGSYLRGMRDTLLDFYVLLDELAPALPRAQALGNRLLPPNVYYVASAPSPDVGGEALRAKYATMTLAQFEHSMDDFHSYFWSRFTQPAGLVESSGCDIEDRVVSAMAGAVHTFVSRTTPMLDAPFTAAALWQRGLSLTYASELRSESATGIASVYDQYAGYFDAVLEAYAAGAAAAVVATPAGRYRAATGAGRGAARFAWWLRRIQGKGLSVLRLIKAAATFDDPLDYLLWKIQRHSGIYIEPSNRQRRHPLLFAWPLLWRLYRRGAFR